MVSLRGQGEEFLVQRSADSLAYGSTLWPAPHNWGWPPSPTLDQTPHEATLHGDTLCLAGPRDAAFGWQMRRKFLVWPDESRFTVWYEVENLTDTVRAVAAWEVTRLPKGSEVFCRIDTQSMPYRALKGMKSELDVTGKYHLWVPASYDGPSQKVSYDGMEPWIATQRGQAMLWRRSQPLTVDQFAPKAGELEIYVDDNTDYIEVEIQGAYRSLAPGASARLRVDWWLAPAPAQPDQVWALVPSEQDSLLRDGGTRY
jgi:hypothetical protein